MVASSTVSSIVWFYAWYQRNQRVDFDEQGDGQGFDKLILVNEDLNPMEEAALGRALDQLVTDGHRTLLIQTDGYAVWDENQLTVYLKNNSEVDEPVDRH